MKAALNIWLASGTLRVVTAKDEKNVFKQFVEVARGEQKHFMTCFPERLPLFYLPRA